jgi:hypothetical protein
MIDITFKGIIGKNTEKVDLNCVAWPESVDVLATGRPVTS